MKIAVGSLNPVKIDAARLAFEAMWPGERYDVIGMTAKSGVSDQPMSDEEAILGATNRAKHVLQLVPDAAWGVGFEGGLHKIHDDYFC